MIVSVACSLRLNTGCVKGANTFDKLITICPLIVTAGYRFLKILIL